MKKETNSNPSRCLPSPLPTLLYPLLLIILLSVIIITTYISTSYIAFTNTNDQTLIPSSIHSHISNLQTQVGHLLDQLHSESPTSNTASKYANRVLAIAVSLDNLADRLSHLYSDAPVDWNNTSNIDGDDELGEGDDGEFDDALPRNGLFGSGEIRNYTSPKPNRHGLKNFLGVEAVYPSIGLACTGAAADIGRFMSYKMYGRCPDDWIMAQKLIVAGCDPLPRRRCFARSPPHYTKPLPLNSSMWGLPGDTNILWTHYKCKSFTCLMSNNTVGKRGFFKCADCFNLSKRGWENATMDRPTSPEFTADEVLALKPTGEIRIGLDFSPTTGTFAAIMRERNVTIASATLNLGAPFSEVIASRGLLPLYLSVGSRLPFFDNTLDIIHSMLFLDGWIGVELLQYVLFDWDRILRPRGLLWIDRFFCGKDNMKLYLDEFHRLGYKKLLWRVVPKTDKDGDELFFSSVLEKPLRA
ncbi:probable methyltransferase At1g29790 [Magnolia sinica]|uniref:probable methyltransferase At1g29790 n=1 Tax=Magnolia sinica TaxID=86752 RepID=UPI00265806B8|nr:probable methyltransferase At1g29790 [Magnolia sinica]